MSYYDALRELAQAHSIDVTYQGHGGSHVEVEDTTLLSTLRAFGVELSEQPDEHELREACRRRHDAEFARPLPRCVVATQSFPYVVKVHVPDGAPAEVTITCEDGTVRGVPQVENHTPAREIDGTWIGEASFEVPADMPLGWHTLTLVSEDFTASCGLVVVPLRLSTTDRYCEQPVAGVMAQLYSVRSEQSWGIGDFHDLGELSALLASKADADFLLVNPLHAAQPCPPVENSPYLPTSRRFINPLYLSVTDIPEYHDLDPEVQEALAAVVEPLQQRNHSAEPLDRNTAYDIKLQALREIFYLGRDQAREQAFRDFVAAEGEGLVEFATWCARRENEIANQGRHAASDEEEHIEFYLWLQWLCDQQLGAAQSQALESGMRIGIMADLAVGIHPDGADAANLAASLAPKASVGAPPDNYNQHGQDWSQPPWHPERLAEEGYTPWRDLLRTVLRHSGGLRIDHILGLFRLFWIPRGGLPAQGTYVHYDYSALVGILVLEAERAQTVVIGEDLGTFEPWVQEYLASRGIMGTSIVWFEQRDGQPLPQDAYRQLALTSVNTHDLPPTAAYLAGGHIELRERLGLLNDPEAERAQDLTWQAAVLDRCREAGVLPRERSFHGVAREDRGDIEDLLVSLHTFIAGCPSALTCTSLVDMTGDTRTQNQPGTTSDVYPNWCQPLSDGEGRAVTIEELADAELFTRVAQAGKRTVR